MASTDELIRRYITTPRGAVDANMRQEPFISAKGTPVWVVVGYYQGGHSQAETAKAFALTEEEVQAALGYYERHEAEIKQRLKSSELTLD